MSITLTSMEIEATVIADLIAVLAAAGITAVSAQQAASTEPTYPRTLVDTEDVRPALLDGQGRPTGIFSVDAVIVGMTQAGDATLDDGDGSALRALLGSIRDAIWQSDLAATLTALGNATYYTWRDNSASTTTEGRLRYGPVRISLTLQPALED